jgi:hypothetical protein
VDEDFKKLTSFVSSKYHKLATLNETFKLIFNYKPPWYDDLVKFTNTDTTTTKSRDPTLTDALVEEFENFKDQTSDTTDKEEKNGGHTSE